LDLWTTSVVDNWIRLTISHIFRLLYRLLCRLLWHILLNLPLILLTCSPYRLSRSSEILISYFNWLLNWLLGDLLLNLLLLLDLLVLLWHRISLGLISSSICLVYLVGFLSMMPNLVGLRWSCILMCQWFPSLI